MANHTLLLPSHLDAQPVLSLVKLIALLRSKYKNRRAECHKGGVGENRRIEPVSKIQKSAAYGYSRNFSPPWNLYFATQNTRKTDADAPEFSEKYFFGGR